MADPGVKAMIDVSQSRGVKWDGNMKTTTAHLDAARTEADMNRHRRATARVLDSLRSCKGCEKAARTSKE
jgi:hypothetical protein